MKLRYLVLTIFLVMLFTTVTGGVVQAQSSPQEIVQSTNPSEATQEQIQTVQEWFYSEGDSLDESTRNQVGSWVSEASSSSSSSDSGGTQTLDEEDVPDQVVAEINDNLVLRSYEFDKEAGTVSLVFYARDSTEQIVLTDPSSASGSGVGTVNQKGVTINRQQTVETTFDVGFSSITNSATVWVSAGAGETIYVSNDLEPLVDRIEWQMIPISALASALAVFICGLVHIWWKSRKLNNEYQNIFKKL